MIHAASHLHNDIHDLADARRGSRAASKIYGNKVAVLAGDFLLARASVFLSRLDNCTATELIATAIEQSVSGEMMQARASAQELLQFEHYSTFTYRKTGALVAHSCRASAVLSSASDDVGEALQQYGRHLGIAYQLVDDMLDFKCRHTTTLCLLVNTCIRSVSFE